MIKRPTQKNKENGYAILFAVVVVSLISLLSLGLSNTTYKQLVLSGLASDSQLAFFQSDTGAECALYADNVAALNKNSSGQWKCGLDSNNQVYTFNITNPSNGYKLISTLNNLSTIPCFEFDVDRTLVTPIITTIRSRGYNNCTKSSIKAAEREIKVTYGGAVSDVNPVTWTNVVNVNPSGNNLTKNSPNAWDGGASSTQSIASGDGYVEFTPNAVNVNTMVGLNNGDPDFTVSGTQTYTDIDYAIHLQGPPACGCASNNYLVYENGSLVGSNPFGPYSATDTFKVALESGGTVISYYKNGAVFYTHAVTPIYPLVVDTALYENGSTITSVNISGNWN